MTDKKLVQDPANAGSMLLPDDWHQQAYVI
jgi:hypothetical protein